MTNPLYVYRPFVYKNKESVDYFREESQLWADILDEYNFFKENYVFEPAHELKMLNEVKYQCTRILYNEACACVECVFDSLRDSLNMLGSKKLAEICMTLVHAFIELVEGFPPHVYEFNRLLLERKLKTVPYYRESTEGFIINHKQDKKLYRLKDFNFEPELEWVDNLKNAGYYTKTYNNYGNSSKSFKCYYHEDFWKEVTRDYDQDRIIDVLRLSEDISEQLHILKVIEAEYDNFKKSELNYELPF